MRMPSRASVRGSTVPTLSITSMAAPPGRLKNARALPAAKLSSAAGRRHPPAGARATHRAHEDLRMAKLLLLVLTAAFAGLWVPPPPREAWQGGVRGGGRLRSHRQSKSTKTPRLASLATLPTARCARGGREGASRATGDQLIDRR